MIPKIIHYCWFGRNPLPQSAQKCIKSWKKYCPDYQIIEWNEDNFDIASMPLYVRQAYETKKWAFVTDYVRLKLVYDYGGIYLDTDVELLKNLDPLLNYQAYFGFEGEKYIATGLGFGAEKGCDILLEMMQDYKNIPFLLPDGNYDTLPCPQRNTSALLKRGLLQNGQMQLLEGKIQIFSSEYLCPMDYSSGVIAKTKNTISIHWFSASWQTKEQRELHQKEIDQINHANRVHFIKTIPNRIMIKLLGQEKYNELKNILKRG